MFLNFFKRNKKSETAIPDIKILSREVINAIPVHENGEPLVDIPVNTRIKLREGDGAKWLIPKLRKSVVDKLVHASDALPQGYSFVVMSAYISVSLQQKVWDRKLEKLRMQNPEWNEERILGEVSKYAARPVVGAPHNTGGSVDVIILDDQGNELDMGSPFGGVGIMNHTRCADITNQQMKNRELLYWTMTNAGFFNTNPFEWWHYAYGDRAWAAYTGADHAVYGGIEEDK